MGTIENGHHFFPLKSLQIGDLQSYLSHLSLFLPPEASKFYILVDNRPWLIDLNSRAAHLWQLMVTKSRSSPFANTKAQRYGKNFGKQLDMKSNSRSSTSKPTKFQKWYSLIDAAMLSQRKALIPVKKLRNSLLLNSELHRILYGFIVFEVAWDDVRGINYLNELQTDTSMALEARFMKRWEFDSIEQASSSISTWFLGTHYERLLLREYLDSMIGEGFYDAQEDFSTTNPTSDGESFCRSNECMVDRSPCDRGSNFSLYPINMEYRTSPLQTPPPPPPNGPYKRRKVMKLVRSGALFEDTHSEIVDSQKYSDTSTSTSSCDSENVVEATQYRDVLILFRFNDHDLPFRLREIVMSDLRLLTLLEAGLPSWVIFLQSYPVFSHLYRPWMCPLARALYVIISIVTVLIGFYDLYKNVPVLKATAARLFGPLFDWIENWEMISRIKYLGTMLFLHNVEKAVKWFLTITRAAKSFLSILTQPMSGPFMELFGSLFPFWNTYLEALESLYAVIWISLGSSYHLIVDLVHILLLPLWFFLNVIWSIATSFIYPIVLVLWEILYAPIRLVLALANFVAFLFTCIFDLLGEIWMLASSVIQLASTTETAVSSYEVSIWRSLWNDLFSQIFRAIRSIVNGFVAFFAACNRHRLSIYNHIQEFLLRLSCLCHRSQPLESSRHRPKHRLEDRRKTHTNKHLQQIQRESTSKTKHK